MKLALGCIADDYTGASDLANTLTRCGLRTVQTIGVPPDDLALPDVDAVVVALKSRSIPADEAVRKSRAADQWLRARGAAHVMFKICSTFDSTDEGNIGPVTAALQSDNGDATVLVTPAFPETGRSVYMGNLFVGQIPLNESPLKDHPLNPMHDANLVRVLSRQYPHQVGLLPWTMVSQGAETARKSVSDQSASGVRALVCDAIREDDLVVLGELALGGRLSVGASGLGLGIARVLAANGMATARGGSVIGGAAGGPVACLAGSCSQATLEQITNASNHMPVLQLDVTRILTSRADVVTSAVDWARRHIASEPVLIASSSAPEEVAALQKKHGREYVGQLIEAAMADIAERLVAGGVQRLIVAGGETSGAVVDRLGLTAFLIGDEIAPGVPALRSVGSDTTMRLALKSGNFGGPDFFTRAIASVR